LEEAEGPEDKEKFKENLQSICLSTSFLRSAERAKPDRRLRCRKTSADRGKRFLAERRRDSCTWKKQHGKENVTVL